MEKDSKNLGKAEKDLEDAQGLKTENLARDKEEFSKRKQNTEKVKAEKEAVLKTLSKLSFDSREIAESERDKARTKKKSILDKIEKADEESKKAEKTYASEKSVLETLVKSLGKAKKEAEERRKKLEAAVKKNQFESVDECLKFVLPEEKIAEADEEIGSYRQEVTTNKKQLRC